MLIVEKVRYRIKTRSTHHEGNWRWWMEMYESLEQAKLAVAESKAHNPLKYEYRIVKWEIHESEV